MTQPIDVREFVAHRELGEAIDFRKIISLIEGNDHVGVQWREAIAEAALVEPVDWRQGVQILCGMSPALGIHWRRSLLDNFDAFMLNLSGGETGFIIVGTITPALYDPNDVESFFSTGPVTSLPAGLGSTYPTPHWWWQGDINDEFNDFSAVISFTAHHVSGISGGCFFVANLSPLWTTLNFDMVEFFGSLDIQIASLTALDLSDLKAVFFGYFRLSQFAHLTALDMPELAYVNDRLIISECPLVTHIDLSKLQVIGGLVKIGSEDETASPLEMPDLVTFALPSLKSLGGNFSVLGTALDQDSIDGLLVTLAALDGSNGTTTYDGHIITMTGGCAAPGSLGLAAIAALEARGNTVHVN